jgi:hypothetical protein
MQSSVLNQAVIYRPIGFKQKTNRKERKNLQYAEEKGQLNTGG